MNLTKTKKMYTLMKDVHGHHAYTLMYIADFYMSCGHICTSAQARLFTNFQPHMSQRFSRLRAR